MFQAPTSWSSCAAERKQPAGCCGVPTGARSPGMAVVNQRQRQQSALPTNHLHPALHPRTTMPFPATPCNWIVTIQACRQWSRSKGGMIALQAHAGSTTPPHMRCKPVRRTSVGCSSLPLAAQRPLPGVCSNKGRPHHAALGCAGVRPPELCSEARQSARSPFCAGPCSMQQHGSVQGQMPLPEDESQEESRHQLACPHTCPHLAAPALAGSSHLQPHWQVDSCHAEGRQRQRTTVSVASLPSAG